MNIFNSEETKCMKQSIVTFLGFLFFQANAQKGIENLVNAEKKFAAWSVAHGTKDAFLKFMDSNAIVFEKGQPVNALPFWKEKNSQAGILDWYPLTAGISSTGDFGYTSGPWFYKIPASDTIVASGQFTSIWHLDKNGEWKFILDMGTTNVPLPKLIDTIVWKKKPVPKFKKGNLSSMLATDSAFVTLQLNNSENAYKNFISTVFLFNRSGQLPQEGQWKNLTREITYKTLGYGISPSRDLGYVYGIATISPQSDNFLRIWRREGTQWKLVLEVLRIPPQSPIKP